jgi:hypothetical protein
MARPSSGGTSRRGSSDAITAAFRIQLRGGDRMANRRYLELPEMFMLQIRGDRSKRIESGV